MQKIHIISTIQFPKNVKDVFRLKIKIPAVNSIVAIKHFNCVSSWYPPIKGLLKDITEITITDSIKYPNIENITSVEISFILSNSIVLKT